jgi:acyl-CoA thioesterase
LLLFFQSQTTCQHSCILKQIHTAFLYWKIITTRQTLAIYEHCAIHANILIPELVWTLFQFELFRAANGHHPFRLRRAATEQHVWVWASKQEESEHSEQRCYLKRYIDV